jgi:radical SAM protein with 4Fe4S-binding SPASM domain
MDNLASLQWHITHRCGNRCSHCYIKNYEQEEVDLTTAKKILADFRNFSLALNAESVLAISGGDPLLSGNFWKILKKAKTFCKRVVVLGNPELLTPQNIQRLKRNQIDEYQLSLDGMQITHDLIRYKGSFKKTSKAIVDLLAAGIEVSVMSTVSARNYQDMISVMKHVYSLGGKYWTFSRWIPSHGDCGIAPKEYKKFLSDILSAHDEFNGVREFTTKDPLYAALLDRKDSSEKFIEGGCSLGCSRLVMLPDSTIMACRRHPDSSLGKWDGPGSFLDKFLFHEKMSRYRDIEKIEGCKDCRFLYNCRGCRAASFASAGKVFAKDPQCWL